MKKYRKLTLSLIALAVYVIFNFLPGTETLSTTGFQVLGVFLATMILWLGVSVTWPTLFCFVALALTPLYTGNTVFSTAYSAWVPTFVLFSSIMCYALTKTGFLRRMAVWLITRPFARNRPWAFVSMLFLAPLIIGMFMDMIALFAIILPITVQIFDELGYSRGNRTAQALTFGVMFTTCLSAITTPFAHTFPLMAISYYSQFFPDQPEISMAMFSVAGIATALIIFVLLMLVMRFIVKPDLSSLLNINVEFLLREHKPMSRQEKISVSVFAVVLVMWIFPGIFGNAFPRVFAVLADLGSIIPPVIGAALLCLIKVNGEPVLDYDDAFKNGVPWKIWMLVTAAMVLGSALTDGSAGIVTWISELIGPAVSSMTSYSAIIITTFILLALTNVMSNAVALTLICTIALPLLSHGNITGVNAAALAVVFGMAANVAVATVPASAPPAMAVGDGWLSNGFMLKWGVIMTILSGIVLVFITYPLLTVLL